MKVSMVVDRMDIWGGVETHVRDLARQIMDKRHEVSIITGATGVASDVLEQDGVKVIECPELIPNIRRPDIYLKAVFNVVSLLKKEAPNVTHSHNLGSELPTSVASRLLNIPSVHTYHGGPFGSKGNIHKKVIQGAIHSISSVFDRGHTIFVSDFNRDHAVKRGYVSAHKSTRIYNGIPDIQVESKRNSSQTIKMAMVARLCPGKDHLTVLEALAKIKDADWQMTFAGKGKDSDHVSKLLSTAKALGIDKKCHFIGEISEIPELLSEQDILVHASHQEALGIAIIEGMRASLPIVATHVGGIPEMVKDEWNGFTFPDADADALVEKLQILMSDKSLRQSMGKYGRRVYEESFVSYSMGDRVMDVYDRAIEEHKNLLHLPRPNFLRYNAS